MAHRTVDSLYSHKEGFVEGGFVSRLHVLGRGMLGLGTSLGPEGARLLFTVETTLRRNGGALRLASGGKGLRKRVGV
jgi:hypothetical protein